MNAIDLKTSHTESTKGNDNVFPYTSASGRVVIGTAKIIDNHITPPQHSEINPDQVDIEMARLEQAIKNAIKQHQTDTDQVYALTQNPELKILAKVEQGAMQAMSVNIIPYIKDGGYQRRKDAAAAEGETFAETRKDTQRGYTALFATYKAFENMLNKIKKNGDNDFNNKLVAQMEAAQNYILSDWKECARPSLAHLESGDIPVINKPTLNAIPHFFEPDGTVKLAACYTLGGTPTDHFHIIAEGAGIAIAHQNPEAKCTIRNDALAITRPDGETRVITDGTLIILDGINKQLIMDPAPATLAKYEHIQHTQQTEYQTLILKSEAENGEKPKTLDGKPVRVSGNISMPQEVSGINETYGNGIGLHRTEVLLEGRTQAVSQDEFYKLFSDITASLKSDVYDIRIVDFEGDKATKMSSEAQKETIRNQMAAVLQLRHEQSTKRTKRIDLMFPNIASQEDFEEKQNMLDDVAQKHNLPSFKLGAMAEIITFINNREMGQADWSFASIGTNDLTASALGIDRYNEEEVKHSDPTNPTVLEYIAKALSYAEWEDPNNYRAVSICGKMAETPHYAPLLIGLGARSLSCGPDNIPVIKELVRRIDTQEAKLLTTAVMNETKREERERLIWEFCEERLGLKRGTTLPNPDWERPKEPYSPNSPVKLHDQENGPNPNKTVG